MESWVDSEPSGFSLSNLPLGIFSTELLSPRIGVAIGKYVLDFKSFVMEGLLAHLNIDWSQVDFATLNDYAALGRSRHRTIRKFLQELLISDTRYGSLLRDHPQRRQSLLVLRASATMHLPMRVGDYTDFFVGINHARNCNKLFRGDATLAASYTEQPIGYHGRASSVVISGTPVRRPVGQFNLDGQVFFGPTRKMDFEVEFAAFISKPNTLGEPIGVEAAEEHIFGYVILNDWSSRDIQQREAFPLGPFNAKNFGTTISPWVIQPDALIPYKTKPISTGSELPKYLVERSSNSVHDIVVDVTIKRGSQDFQLSKCNFKNVIFSFPQMIAHHTAGGCPLQTGDLIATGTVSGETVDTLGCLLEITKNGMEPYQIFNNDTGSTLEMGWLHDGDCIEFHGYAGDSSDPEHISFGSCTGLILPSLVTSLEKL
ncbi:uncharacterized protein N7496_008045 [Penicillium cataractarum]|uniref:Fumarylacetoacetase n=1 Tax=Penicillium cataractarum TaxID=2100454 RepID=A0A9W9RXW5_9EURO|nr:uncharacterized protein N7496_008045 [Penicillium cataractarum]KAJ5368285.1 hypothetical protein N7496_008045 [Penicillium cataractarum]